MSAKPASIAKIQRLNLTAREVRTVERFRINRKDHDRMSSEKVVAKYRRFLQIYELVRLADGEWVTRDHIADLAGISRRQARRILSLFRHIDWPTIEVDYSEMARPLQSRMRWRSDEHQP